MGFMVDSGACSVNPFQFQFHLYTNSKDGEGGRVDTVNCCDRISVLIGG